MLFCQPSRCVRFAAVWRPAKASCGPELGCSTRPTPLADLRNGLSSPGEVPRRGAGPQGFKNKLLSLDAMRHRSVRSLGPVPAHQVKLHLVLDHDGYLPTWRRPAKCRSTAARRGPIDRGDYVVRRASERGVFFVTRLKRGANYEVLEQRPLPRRPGGVRRDADLLSLAGRQRLRGGVPASNTSTPSSAHARVLDEHLGLAAATIAAIYQDRWQVELFLLSKNLRVKTFVGTSANALKIQIWTALIAILLLRYLKLRARWGWSLSNLVALLRQQLFVHRELFAWLDEPFHPPPGSEPESPQQLLLAGMEA